ncbi:MAG: tRNA pseudouridine(38-40) synthase TruA [Bacteroidota bacterium]
MAKQRYFLELSYDGTNYHGWQRQPNVVSVQEVIEQALKKVLKQPIALIGCGRTDAGVHARAYIAHIDVIDPLAADFRAKLNFTLPEAISIQRIWPVVRGLHAQFSALERTYRYNVHTSKNPFQARFSTYLPVPLTELDWDAMQSAAQLLLEHTEYRGCCKVPDRHDSTICRVTAAKFIRTADDAFYFSITANRFLRGMVRLLTAQLLDIGQGREALEDFAQRLERAERPKRFVYAAAQGLSLDRVRYPEL